MRLACVSFTILLLFSGCGGPKSTSMTISSPDGPPWFRDATAEIGLDFRHDAGPTGRYFMPQIMGSGAAMLDFNNDGRFDLYFLQNGGPGSTSRNRLFRQRSDGRFEDVSAGSGLDLAGYGMGVAVGDFDNDGWVDVYVSQYGGGRLFRNKGDGTFEDVTRSAGIEQSAWGTSCCFFDYNRDGWLDLVVINYLDYDPTHDCGPASGKPDYCHPDTFPGMALQLLRNRGRDASGRWLGFEDVTHAAGLHKRMPGLGVVCADFNGDGWPDILAANDAKANCLWINNQKGGFTDEALSRGVAFNSAGQAQSNMGVALGDVHSDGRMDLFITHLTEETHTLWRQTSPGQFRDSTAAAGLAATHWRGTGFGTILADFDLDGALDIAVVHGRVSRGKATAVADLEPFWAPYSERNRLLAGDGKGQFHDISENNGDFCRSYAVSRGLIWGDFDGDGRIDLVTTAVAGPARFYRNVTATGGHWLMVRAYDPALNRDAYGAMVTIRAGGRRWVGMVNPGQSYLSSGDPRAHFGLGSVPSVDDIRIDWPDGLAEIFPGCGVDRVLRLERGKGKKAGS